MSKKLRKRLVILSRYRWLSPSGERSIMVKILEKGVLICIFGAKLGKIW